MSLDRLMLIVFATATILLLILFYEVAVWRECIVSHPWWFCLRILG